ncbi:MAG: class I SAM-dependent methyltransferase [Firmicutes bacterium]|nr:class I SAM-dependent methyltransferase [Bacillota bacterium]
MKNLYVDIWNDLHKNFIKNNNFKYDNWLDEFETIISNVETEVIDLGCGVTGNNTLYLLEKGKKVISCDFAEEALNVVKEIKGSKTLLFDMLDTFPFKDNSTELVIADLCLHYFKEKDTKRIISEIKRILKPNGYLFLRLNSTNSTEYNKIIESGEKEIELNLFFTQNMEKRFFNEKDIYKFFKDFEIISMKEENMTRWCNDKIVWKCAIKNR